MQKPYPAPTLDENQVFDAADIKLLQEITESDDDPDQLHFHLVRQLLAVEGKYQHAARRAGLFDELNEVLEYNAFKNEREALEFAVDRHLNLENAKTQQDPQYMQAVSVSRPVIRIAQVGQSDAELTVED